MKVSVGICTYNGEKYIADQLNSIIAQSRKPDEIILCDDSSVDNTANIAKNILDRSGIVYRMIINSPRLGVTKNFSNCLDLCTGDVIFSCDQDDVWMPDKIESFLPYFEQGCNFVYSNAHIIDSSRTIIHNDFWSTYGINFPALSSDQFSKLLLTTLCIAGCNMAFSKELYDRIKPIPLHFLHDGWIAICAPLFGNIAFINKPLIEYRVHGANTSGVSVDNIRSSVSNSSAIRSKLSAFRERLVPYFYDMPDQWFGNQHLYICNQIFYNRMHDVFTPEFDALVKQSIHFYGTLLRCLPKHRAKSLILLFQEFSNGNYRLFRGGIKRFIKDCIYLSINKNISFEHNTNVW